MRKVVAALAFATGLALFSSPAQGQPYPPAPSEGPSGSQSTARQGASIVVAGNSAKPDATTTHSEVLGVTRIQMLATTAGALAFINSDVAPGLIIGVGLIVAGGLLLLAVRRRSSTA